MSKTTLATYDNAGLQPAMFPEDARTIAGVLGPSQTNLAAGTVLGKKTSDGKLYPYNNGASDGTETAVGILRDRVSTDANGKVYPADNATASTANVPQGETAAVYVAGTFDTNDLTGWDANAATDLNALTLFSDLVRIPN